MYAEAKAKMMRDSKEVVEGLLAAVRCKVQESLSELHRNLIYGYDDASSSNAIRAVDTLQVKRIWMKRGGELVQILLHSRWQFSTVGYWTASVQRRSAGGEEGTVTTITAAEFVCIFNMPSQAHFLTAHAESTLSLPFAKGGTSMHTVSYHPSVEYWYCDTVPPRG